MAVWGTWHGGVNYSAPSIPADVEWFDSTEDARLALAERATHGHWSRQYFGYVNRDRDYTLTPCADEGAEMRVYFSDPSDDPNAEPDVTFVTNDDGDAVQLEW